MIHNDNFDTFCAGIFDSRDVEGLAFKFSTENHPKTRLRDILLPPIAAPYCSWGLAMAVMAFPDISELVGGPFFTIRPSVWAFPEPYENGAALASNSYGPPLLPSAGNVWPPRTEIELTWVDANNGRVRMGGVSTVIPVYPTVNRLSPKWGSAWGIRGDLLTGNVPWGPSFKYTLRYHAPHFPYQALVDKLTEAGCMDTTPNYAEFFAARTAIEKTALAVVELYRESSRA